MGHLYDFRLVDLLCISYWKWISTGTTSLALSWCHMHQLLNSLFKTYLDKEYNSKVT